MNRMIKIIMNDMKEKTYEIPTVEYLKKIIKKLESNIKNLTNTK